MKRSSVNPFHLLRAAVLTTLIVLWPKPGEAACVSGLIRFYNELGNFCDSGVEDCSGWLFTDATQNTLQPLPGVLLELRNSANTVIGSGETDGNGHYQICYSGNPGSSVLRVYPEYEDGGFKIHTSAGGRWTLTCNMTLGLVSSVRNCSFGSDGSPHSIASLYYSAAIAYLNSVAWMHRPWMYFNNVSIRMDHTGSATFGYDKIINILDSTTAELNFATVMHEMGHVSTHLGSQLQYLGPDSGNKGAGVVYDACGGNTSWDFYSNDECGDVVFMESIAEHFGAWARQLPNTKKPCTGRAGRQEACQPSGFNLETPEACSTRKRVVDYTRYLWDTYDSDKPGDTEYADIDEDVYDEALVAYPIGRDNHDKSENWCCTFWTCNPCDHDDKNMSDYDFHLTNLAITDNNIGFACF